MCARRLLRALSQRIGNVQGQLRQRLRHARPQLQKHEVNSTYVHALAHVAAHALAHVAAHALALD
eukprot:4458613-Pleurochrysis_carterae.AAC.1